MEEHLKDKYGAQRVTLTRVEHALANEHGASGAKQPDAVTDYPYTNRSRLPGISIYRQLEPAYVA